jgi:hypothetical protein
MRRDDRRVTESGVAAVGPGRRPAQFTLKRRGWAESLEPG